MGCCLSRPGRGDAPYAATQPDASQRNINDPTPTASTDSSPRGSASNGSGPRGAAENRPNVPIKPINPAHRARLPKSLTSPTSSGPWTRQRLEKERNDWWDTRTTGSAEIWAALRNMVQSLQAGNIAEAQAVLDATECTCPNGMLWRGIFDSRGDYYKVAEWVVIEPDGLVDEEDLKDEVGSVGEDEDKEGEEESLGEEVMVKCRLSSTSQDYSVEIRKGERVASLVRKLKSKAGIHPDTNIKIVYAGRIIDPHKPLDSHPHWSYDPTHVLIAMVLG